MIPARPIVEAVEAVLAATVLATLAYAVLRLCRKHPGEARAAAPLNLVTPPGPRGTPPAAALALALLIALAAVGQVLLLLPRVLP